MRNSWIKLYVASVLEVGWVVGLAHAYDVLTWGVTVVLIVVSNYLLLSAAKDLPTGTVYAVFVGLGTAGTVIAGILFFAEPFIWLKLLLIFLLLVGILGLKLTSDDEPADLIGGDS